MIAAMIAAISIVSFGDAFAVDTAFEISTELGLSGEKGCTFWSYCAVDPDGARVAFIDPTSDEVRTYDLAAGQVATTVRHSETAGYTWFDSTEEIEGPDGKRIARLVDRKSPSRDKEQDSAEVPSPVEGHPVQTVARNGRQRDEVDAPVAIAYDREGRLLVSDLGHRRVSVFNADGSFANSFLLGPDEDAPSEIRALPNGNFLCANLRLDRKGRLNAGHHSNVYSATGRCLRSLAYTPESALERNLWTGVAAVLDVDSRGNAYQAFSVDPEIHVYDVAGQERRTFGGDAPWFVYPPTLRAPIFERETTLSGFSESWTRLIKIVCVGDDRILRVALTNAKVPGTGQPFLIDVFSSDGSPLATNVESDAWPVGADRAGNIYLLTIKGDRLLKTHLVGKAQR